MDRARFEAAKWVDGSSVYGVIRAPVTYAIDSWPSENEQLRAYPPDMALSVNRLSAGAGARVKVNLAIAADENGRVVGCIERPPFSSHARDKHFPELIDIACQQVTSKFTALIAKDKSGKPVRSIQNVTVLFSSGE